MELTLKCFLPIKNRPQCRSGFLFFYFANYTDANDLALSN